MLCSPVVHMFDSNNTLTLSHVTPAANGWKCNPTHHAVCYAYGTMNATRNKTAKNIYRSSRNVLVSVWFETFECKHVHVRQNRRRQTIWIHLHNTERASKQEFLVDFAVVRQPKCIKIILKQLNVEQIQFERVSSVTIEYRIEKRKKIEEKYEVFFLLKISMNNIQSETKLGKWTELKLCFVNASEHKVQKVKSSEKATNRFWFLQ